MKIVIIKHDDRSAHEIRKILEALDKSISILAILLSVDAAEQWFSKDKNLRPDLIFSDIELADGTSFDILEKIEIPIPIVFCSPFEKYPLQIFEVNIIDYLSSPIDAIKLQNAIHKYDRIKAYNESKEPECHRTCLLGSIQYLETNYKQSILVHYKESIIPVKSTNIGYIHLGFGVVSIYTQNRVYTSQYTIEQLEKMLDPQHFYRVNRQTIINRQHIAAVEYYFSRRLLVKTVFEISDKIVVSKSRTQDFLKWLEY
jgi:two-component system response regulator LytT